MAARSPTSRQRTGGIWNDFSPRRSNCAEPPLGYNSRPARTRTPARPPAARAVETALILERADPILRSAGPDPNPPRPAACGEANNNRGVSDEQQRANAT